MYSRFRVILEDRDLKYVLIQEEIIDYNNIIIYFA